MIFLQGEVRVVGIEVVSQNREDFVIEGADYRIIKPDGTEVNEGSATIDGHKVLTLFSATEQGPIFCEFTYRIGPEILKAKVYVEVR